MPRARGRPPAVAAASGRRCRSGTARTSSATCVPLITPIIVVLGLVVYVLNLSRVFLSAHGHTSVIVGSTITVVILVGATVLANSSRLRRQTDRVDDRRFPVRGVRRRAGSCSGTRR